MKAISAALIAREHISLEDSRTALRLGKTVDELQSSQQIYRASPKLYIYPKLDQWIF